MASIVGSLGASLSNNSQGHSLSLPLEFSLNNLWFLGALLLVHSKVLFFQECDLTCPCTVTSSWGASTLCALVYDGQLLFSPMQGTFIKKFEHGINIYRHRLWEDFYSLSWVASMLCQTITFPGVLQPGLPLAHSVECLSTLVLLDGLSHLSNTTLCCEELRHAVSVAEPFHNG